MKQVQGAKKQIKKFDDSNLDSSLGNSVEAELPSNTYTNKVLLTVNLGQATDGSGNDVSWNSGAAKDLFDAIKLNVNGEVFEVDGDLVNYVNTFNSGLEYQKQFVIDFRVPNVFGNGRPTGMIRGGDWATAQVELELDKVSDISNGGTSQTGTEVVVSGLQTQGGSTSAMWRTQPTYESVGSGRDQFEMNLNGRLYRTIIKEDGADIDEMTVEVITYNGEYEVFDDAVDVLRRENVQDAGTTELPQGYYVIDFDRVADFTNEDVKFIRVQTEASTSGGLVVYPYTLEEV